MSEAKAFFTATIASLILLGAIFGFSAIMRKATASPPEPETASSSSPVAVAGPSGKALFANNCASCHGDNGEGGYGPDLRKRARTVAQIAAVVTKGVPDKMPAYGTKLKPEAIQAVSAYSASLSGK